MVPPSVSIRASGNQTVGQPLTLECCAVDTNCGTASVEFVWSKGGVQLRQIEGTGFCYRSGNLSVCTDTYDISILNTSDDGAVAAYQCDVTIQDSPPVTATSSITLNLNGMAYVVKFPKMIIFTNFRFHEILD